ncbi:MAG: response regulator transcription factor [Deltaproteobacteria bacterium]
MATGGAKKRILIIEDEREISHILKLRLESAGYEVLQAFDGEQGYKMAVGQKPDLILLDLILPQKGGLQVLDDLKADAKHRKIPVILITGLAQELEDVRKGALMADGYFLKPFDSLELMAAIAASFDKGTSRRNSRA